MGATEAALSTDALERKLNVRRRARADGARDDPGAGAHDLAACEREILAAVSAAHDRFAQARAEAGAALAQRLRAIPLPTAAFESEIAGARLELRRIAGREGPDLARLAADASRAEAELEQFRARNQLARPAIYPGSTVLAAALLAVAAVFEAAFSATLFMDAPEAGGGYLSAIAIALGLSGANVATGFLAGFLGLRYLQHVRPLVRGLGAAAFAAGLAAAFGLNAFAALWRERLAGEAVFGEASGWLDRLAHLSTPQAVILLMLGGGVWVFSALKGYSGVDDPYPDYGKMHRAAARAAEAHADARADVREDMEAAIAAAEAKARSAVEAAGDAARARRAAYEDAAAAIAALEARARQSEAAGAALIELYRRENRAARAAPAPAYFNDTPPPPHPFADVLEAASRLVMEGEAHLAQERARLAAALETLAADLDPGAGG